MTALPTYRCDRCGSLGTAEEFNTNAWVEMTLYPEGDEDGQVTKHLCPPCNTTLHQGFLANVGTISVSAPNRLIGFEEKR